MSQPWGEVIEVKANFVQRLKHELGRGAKGVYGIGTVTDPYQPLEKKHELTRGALSILKRSGAKISILTKSDLVLRDIDILQSWKDVEVGVSVSCLDERLARIIEPGAPSPARRLNALSELASAGISTYLMAAPIIPCVDDSEGELKGIVRAALQASAKTIMWDKFNPKPLALSRLKRTLAAHDIILAETDVEEWQQRVGSALTNEGKSLGVRVVDAF
jgi:DNA repair photolyase